MSQIYDDKTINRFLSYVEQGDNENDCWNWIGGCNKKGYGRFRLNDKMLGAHRFSFEMHNNRKIKEGLVIMHACDNPKCCNPNHLSEGSHQDNMNDRNNKNRQYSKLTADQVRLIRIKYDLYANTTIKSLAKEFNVSNDLISKIINFKRWKHL